MRVHCYVDGFNLYHAVDALGQNHLKWLNLRKLAEAFITPTTQRITEVFYFSAYATWRSPGSRSRHRTYVKALQEQGVTAILGHFKTKSITCRGCRTTWNTREEKESDVNIAIRLIHEAHEDNFDKALIITSDSDLCPAIRMVKNHFPSKEIVVLAPPNRYDITREIQGLATTIRIRQPHLNRNLLPDSICDSYGNVINRPAYYDPPVSTPQTPLLTSGMPLTITVPFVSAPAP